MPKYALSSGTYRPRRRTGGPDSNPLTAFGESVDNGIRYRIILLCLQHNIPTDAPVDDLTQHMKEHRGLPDTIEMVVDTNIRRYQSSGKSSCITMEKTLVPSCFLSLSIPRTNLEAIHSQSVIPLCLDTYQSDLLLGHQASEGYLLACGKDLIHLHSCRSTHIGPFLSP